MNWMILGERLGRISDWTAENKYPVHSRQERTLPTRQVETKADVETEIAGDSSILLLS